MVNAKTNVSFTPSKDYWQNVDSCVNSSISLITYCKQLQKLSASLDGYHLLVTVNPPSTRRLCPLTYLDSSLPK